MTGDAARDPAASARPRFEIGWYNGWTPDERHAVTPVQREAVADGRLERPRSCSVCAARWRRDNPVWFHSEDYGQPLEVFHICRMCHRALHQRFEAREPWLALVQAHGDGTRWFERLTMDPASLRRPFRETYPDGVTDRRDAETHGQDASEGRRGSDANSSPRDAVRSLRAGG